MLSLISKAWPESDEEARSSECCGTVLVIVTLHCDAAIRLLIKTSPKCAMDETQFEYRLCMGSLSSAICSLMWLLSANEEVKF